MSRNRIDIKFVELKNKNQKGLITFITAGDPNLNKTVELVLAMEEAGADIIELGVPFSDPLADGPVIQQASIRALKNGTSLTKIIDTVRIIREKSQVPLVLMTYFNPVCHMGLENFVEAAAKAGVDGLIVPDLPYEESHQLNDLMKQYNLNLIPLVAPTTPAARIKDITSSAGGFVYCVSLTGVTGMRDSISTDIKGFMEDVKAATEVPVAIGFGISNPEQAAKMSKECEAVIVGSALVRLVGELGDTEEMIDSVKTQVRALKEGILG